MLVTINVERELLSVIPSSGVGKQVETRHPVASHGIVFNLEPVEMTLRLFRCKGTVFAMLLLSSNGIGRTWRMMTDMLDFSLWDSGTSHLLLVVCLVCQICYDACSTG